MTDEWRSLKDPAALLQSEFSNSEDVFLIWQIELWSINRRVFQKLGADVASSAAIRSGVELERLEDAYTAWHGQWKQALRSQEGAQLQLQEFLVDFFYHSGRLFLLSHIFRGNDSSSGRPSQDAPGQAVRRAFSSALSVVSCTTNWYEAARWLPNLPSYFCTMVAFACVCLIRASAQPQGSSQVNLHKARSQVQALIEVLRSIQSKSHPLFSFARTLELAIGESQAADPASNGGGIDIDLVSGFNWDMFWNESISSDLLSNDMTWMFHTDDADPCFDQAQQICRSH